MIFCKVDEALLDILHKVANGRRIIDLGAGECLFESMYRKKYPDAGILSVELYPEHYDHFFIPRSNIVRFFAERMEVTTNDLPIFIRPCHSQSFVPATLKHIEFDVPEAIYISNKRNIIMDIPEEYTYETVGDWRGKDDDEQIFRIRLYGEPYVATEKDWWMVKLDGWEKPTKMERIERYGDFHFVNTKGGGFPCKAADFAEKITN
jgi:hypothetical protein